MKRIDYLIAHAWLVLSLGTLPALAEEGGVDWPQLHGPAHNNTTPESGWRKDWPLDGPPALWKTQAGMGMASLAVVGERVFTAGNDGHDRDTVFCLDLATGKPVWRHDYPCPSAAHEMSIVPGGPCATPCVSDGRVFSISREGDLFCLESATGAVVWQKNLVRDFHGHRPFMVMPAARWCGRGSCSSMPEGTWGPRFASMRPMAKRSGRRGKARPAMPRR
jgi:outer membrane protein assembly factor BamB